MNLRNKPIDRRRLSAQDRHDYNKSGAHQSRVNALKKVKQWRGQQAWQANSPKKTQVHTPGTGGTTSTEWRHGRHIQQDRQRDVGSTNRRSDQLKNEGIQKSNRGDIYKEYNMQGLGIDLELPGF